MKRITDSELLELSFGSKIRVIWHNSPRHERGDEYYGIIFGDKIGYEDGLVDDKRNIAECIYNDWCMVYLVFNTEDDKTRNLNKMKQSNMGKNKYNIGDKVKAKIHYVNDSRREVEAIIIEIIENSYNIMYLIWFELDEIGKILGSTGGCCYIDQDDIIGLSQKSEEMEIEVIRDRYNYLYDICQHCNSELKIKKSDINYHYNNGYNVADIKCPCCNKEFRIKQ